MDCFLFLSCVQIIHRLWWLLHYSTRLVQNFCGNALLLLNNLRDLKWWFQDIHDWTALPFFLFICSLLLEIWITLISIWKTAIINGWVKGRVVIFSRTIFKMNLFRRIRLNNDLSPFDLDFFVSKLHWTLFILMIVVIHSWGKDLMNWLIVHLLQLQSVQRLLCSWPDQRRNKRTSEAGTCFFPL